MFHRTIAAALVAAGLAVPAGAQSTLDMPVGELRDFNRDSGRLANVSNQMTTVYRNIVQADGAAWMRLYFDGETTLDDHSFIRVTSLLDMEVQELYTTTLEMWRYSTAYFNGDALLVEVIAAPNTTTNRVVVATVHVEIGQPVPVGGCGICGADNRVPSDQDFAARLMPAGCSSTVFNEQSCMVTAGHCIGPGDVVQFRVPSSSPNCQLNNPPTADQFPIIDEQGVNDGPGNDWAVMIPGTNNLGQKPYERYGALREIATTAPGAGQAMTIWGYGVDNQCTQNQIQQTSGGSITSVGGTSFNHNVDATFGNSGSSLIRNSDQRIVGIATHCPCPNWATRWDHPSFTAARNSLCPFVPPIGDGACCLSDGGCIGQQTLSDCQTLGGEYQGDDTGCGDVVCALGACCLDSDACIDGITESDCTFFGGEYQGDDSNCGAIVCGDKPDCPEDIDGDGTVGFSDLVQLLSVWGPCPGCPEDISGDDNVGFSDLVQLLSAWGPC